MFVKEWIGTDVGCDFGDYVALTEDEDDDGDECAILIPRSYPVF